MEVAGKIYTNSYKIEAMLRRLLFWVILSHYLWTMIHKPNSVKTLVKRSFAFELDSHSFL